MAWRESTAMETEFTLAEIMEMEHLYKEKGAESLREKFCQELATRFSFSTHRTGKSIIQRKQVQSWFQDKHKKVVAKVTLPPAALDELVVSSSKTAIKRASRNFKQIVLSDAPIENAAIITPLKPKAERIAELSELVFEAISSKDCAWFDVAAFLNYRIVSSGELEVRVRFSGFGNEEDEWVNVRRGVRQRSIPLEPSECHRINVGDVVLCFRENDDHALYSDACVVHVERTSHDSNSCSCIFVVRFDYDDAEDQVDLTQICYRPT